MDERLGIKLSAARDQINGDTLVVIRIPEYVTRTDGEFKWRIAQAVILALTAKETYPGVDTPEGFQRLLQMLCAEGT